LLPPDCCAGLIGWPFLRCIEVRMWQRRRPCLAHALLCEAARWHDEWCGPSKPIEHPHQVDLQPPRGVTSPTPSPSPSPLRCLAPMQAPTCSAGPGLAARLCSSAPKESTRPHLQPPREVAVPSLKLRGVRKRSGNQQGGEHSRQDVLHQEGPGCGQAGGAVGERTRVHLCVRGRCREVKEASVGSTQRGRQQTTFWRGVGGEPVSSAQT